MEARGIRLQGERGISRQTIAQGMPECSGCTCMLVCALPRAHCTRDRGCSKHPAFPAPSRLEGKEFQQTSGAVRRGNANVHLNDGGARNFVARMERSEIRGACRCGRGIRIALRSIRATWPYRRLKGCANARRLPLRRHRNPAQSRRPISTQSWVLRRSAMLTASQMPIAVSATVKASAATLASIR